MVPKRRLIIDTDVGGDDVIALLLALNESPDDAEVLLISVVWGNVNVEKGLRNVVALFHVLDMEMKWRKERGRPPGFDSMNACRPVVAVGSPNALGEDVVKKEDGFHGPDGLHNLHTIHPHLSPPDSWNTLFDDGPSMCEEDMPFYRYFTPSKSPAHEEIIRILREEPADTVTICAVGPMTNLAMAADADPEAFLRMKELLVMGGAVHVPGNITPVAEANTWNDAYACARVFALSSSRPTSTTPSPTHCKTLFRPYPDTLSKRLEIKLFPLDLTLSHRIDYADFLQAVKLQLDSGGPLATFVNTFLSGILRKVRYQYGMNAPSQLSLHDPVTIWFALRSESHGWRLSNPEDIRIETSKGWTIGMHVSDQRGKRRANGAEETEIDGDKDGWLSSVRGNRITRVLDSPGPEAYHRFIMKLFDN